MSDPAETDDRGLFDARYLAFLETIPQIRPSLHRYCARMTGSVLDGEDIVQEALFHAYRKLDTFDDTRPLSPWLFRIAHNRCIDLVYDPAVHAPICFGAPAARSLLPYYELRTTLALAGRHPDQIAEALQAAYVRGELPRRDAATFAYMFSAHQHLGPGIGAWHPHVMVFVPFATPEAVGGTDFASTLPQISDDAGTPFAVVVVPVDEKQFIRRTTN